MKDGRGNELRLAIDGVLDVEKAKEAETQILEPGMFGRCLVLDLSGVPRFDFSGIVVLIAALEKARVRFAAVSVTGLNERVGKIFAALRNPAATWISAHHPAIGERKWI